MFMPLWAIHIADGLLGTPWLIAGWLIAALLTCIAAYRVREEEIPRVALLTAAFFVASSIHVKLGPSSVHLLLNGLVGVILGRRAPLAILIGVTLQALLIAHGGLTTVGVNTTIQALPALAAGGLFGLLRGWTEDERSWPRSLLIAMGAFVWGACLTFGICALIVNPWRDLVRISADAGLVFSFARLQQVGQLALNPLAIGLLALFVIACVLIASRMRTALAFPAGALVGLFGVLGTLVLAGAVLLFDGADRWGTFVDVVFVAHLPLALIEAGIVGGTVGFLARVQPDLLGAAPPPPPLVVPPTSVRVGPSVPLILALVSLLLLGSDARAHRLKADPAIDVKTKEVTIEAYYETGQIPQQAEVRVLRTDESVLAQGPLDARGLFRFTYVRPEPLRIEITAPGGHRATLRLSAHELGAIEEVLEPTPSRVSLDGTRWSDLFAGLAFVLALASFVLSWRNAQTLRRLVALHAERAA